MRNPTDYSVGRVRISGLTINQLDMSLQKLLGVVACTLGLAPRKGTNGNYTQELTLARGLLFLFPTY